MTSTAAIHPVIGTAEAEVMRGTRMSDVISARGGDDQVLGGNGHDALYGGGGDDLLRGGSGNDFIHGSGGASYVQPTVTTITEDYQGRVVFQGETAGYRNSFGMYKVDPETGAIGDVEMIWENASRRNSGGDLVVGESAATIDLKAGDQLGFFIIANGYSKNNFDRLEGGEYAFIDGDGAPATLDSVNPRLVHIAEDGAVTELNGHKYHTAGFGAHVALNADGQETFADGSTGYLHTTGVLDVDKGALTLGFEDLYRGGDQDFDDTVFTVELGKANAQVLDAHAKMANDPSLTLTEHGLRKVTDAQGDTAGVDIAHIGMKATPDTLVAKVQCHDPDALATLIEEGGSWALTLTLRSETGAPKLVEAWGDSDGTLLMIDGVIQKSTVAVQADGTLRLETELPEGGFADGDRFTWTAVLETEQDGETAQDEYDRVGGLTVESSNDILYGEAGDDVLIGGDGHDVLYGGSSQDELNGGTGDDRLYGGDGHDALNGSRGDDHLDGGSGDDVLSGGSGDDVLIGGKGTNVLNGDSGNDTVDYSWLDSKVRVDLHYKKADKSVDDSLQSIENAIGGRNNDVLRGDRKDNVLDGGEGNDVLRGRSGDDVLTGGAGADRFQYFASDLKGGSVDVITDFSVEEGDRLDFRRLVDKKADDGLDAHVAVTAAEGGLAVSALVDGAWEQVAMLQTEESSLDANDVASAVIV